MISMTNGITATDHYKKQLNELVTHVFGFSFESWHALGIWGDDYECYSIITDHHMIANISVYKMSLLINGRERQYLQLGLVATREENRGQGLARKIMEFIMERYLNVPMFLHANDSVIDFYPKFGFTPVSYKQPYINYHLKNDCGMTRMDLRDPKVKHYLKERGQYSSIFDCANQYAINWFHLLFSYSDHIYEIPELEVMLIAEQSNSILTIYDIVSRKEVAFADIVSYLGFSGGDVIHFGFNPDRLGLEYSLKEYPMNDSTLFIRGDFGVEGEYIIPVMIIT